MPTQDKGFEAFAEAYCFIHGAVHVRSHLQGRVTPCTVSDTDGFRSDFYLWIPYVLPVAILLANIPFLLWENVYEMGLMKFLLADRDANRVCQSFKILRFVYQQ